MNGIINTFGSTVKVYYCLDIKMHCFFEQHAGSDDYQLYVSRSKLTTTVAEQKTVYCGCVTSD